MFLGNCQGQAVGGMYNGVHLAVVQSVKTQLELILREGWSVQSQMNCISIISSTSRHRHGSGHIRKCTQQQGDLT